MSTTSIDIWLSTNTDDSHPWKVSINEDKDIDDLCALLKKNDFCPTLNDIGQAAIDVKDSNSLKSLRRSIKMKDLPQTTDLTPLIIGKCLNNAKSNSNDLLTTPSHQKSASTFANGSLPIQGFGSLPSSFKIDATDGFLVSSALCPTDADIEKVSEDMPLLGELMNMIPRGEEEANGVNIIFNDACSLFRSTANGTTTLHKIGLDLGLATITSKCDHRLMGANNIPSGLIELKGGDHSLLQGNRQAAVYGSHLAMGFLKRGFPIEQVIVPLYTYTGMQIQFGATIVLKPSFPVYWTISKLLDVSDANDRRLAVAYIQKANSWVEHLDSLTLFYQSSIPLNNMELDKSAYYIKTLTDDVCKRGFELFSYQKSGISQGIEHWGRVLNLLFQDRDVRPHVAFPFAIRSPNTSNNENEYMIIYKNLCVEGYKIGCPDRSNESDLFDIFREAYCRVVKMIHKAGVLHCDLYLSNVMWRKRSASSGDVVDVVIIDWDCAHCLIEGNFHPKILEALKNHEPNRNAKFDTSFDDRYVEVLNRKYIDSESKYWADLASDIKPLVDTAFYHLFASPQEKA